MKKKKIKQTVLALLIGTMLMSQGTIYPVHAQELDDKVSILAGTGNVEINTTNFPDSEFSSYVRTFDLDGDNFLSQEELNKVKLIKLTNTTELKNLKGLEYFTNLTDLYCNNTGITTLDISNNKDLEFLNCTLTNITELDTSNNPALLYLWCYKTKITSLDVSNNNALIQLKCYETEIANLDVSKNLALTILDCSFTEVTDLNVQNNTALSELYCYSTAITSLDVSKNLALNKLDCYRTAITSLDVSNNINLVTLGCSETGITSLNVNSNKALSYLNCHSTGITSLDVSNNVELIQLSCFTTGIISLDLSKNVNLNDVNAPINPSRRVGISSGNVTLKSIDVNMDGNKISNLSNATLSKDKKSFENCVAGQTITYDYDCQRVVGMTIIPVSLELFNKNKNEFISPLTIENWTYGQQAKLPTVSSKYGTPYYLYSDSKDGIFTSSVPTKAGTWYVKAIVDETATDMKVESGAVLFTVFAKQLSDISITSSDIKNDSDALIVKDGTITLIEGTDYKVDRKEVNNIVTITINGLGNYQGMIEKSYRKDSNTTDEGDTKDDAKDIKDNNTPNAENTKNNGSPKTGDTSNMMFYLSCIALSSSLINITKKKKEFK